MEIIQWNIPTGKWIKWTDRPVSWDTLPFRGRGFFWVDGHEQRLQAARSKRNDRGNQERIKHSLCICLSSLSVSLFSSPFCAAPLRQGRRAASSSSAPLFHRGKRNGKRWITEWRGDEILLRLSRLRCREEPLLTPLPPSFLFSFFASFLPSYPLPLFHFFSGLGDIFFPSVDTCPPLTPEMKSRAPSHCPHCLPAATASSSFSLCLFLSVSQCSGWLGRPFCSSLHNNKAVNAAG